MLNREVMGVGGWGKSYPSFPHTPLLPLLFFYQSLFSRQILIIFIVSVFLTRVEKTPFDKLRANFVLNVFSLAAGFLVFDEKPLSKKFNNE